MKPGRYYCRACENEKARRYRVRKKDGKTRAYHHADAKVHSTPPEPPPGFDPRDLRNGIPYGSAYANDHEWRDGARPGCFHVRVRTA